jgi:D-lactate dehydrogenase
LPADARHPAYDQCRNAGAGPSRSGALIDTKALIDALKARSVGGVALDVYEQEAGIFFDDLSSEIIDDDLLQRLLTFPNVLVTGHQAFLTEEALTAIAHTTLGSLSNFERGLPLAHQILPAGQSGQGLP